MKLQLRYRGNFYNKTSQLWETVASKFTLKYRGRTYEIKQPTNLNVPDSFVTLKYRGITYIKPCKRES
ncbi:MAG: DUF4278 domain-containing protein [Oscillatoria sp. PMC 1068.18]|nr:DUF4278 domain-containing protein [Oscillatoria sp. PMC 1068.18]